MKLQLLPSLSHTLLITVLSTFKNPMCLYKSNVSLPLRQSYTKLTTPFSFSSSPSVSWGGQSNPSNPPMDFICDSSLFHSIQNLESFCHYYAFIYSCTHGTRATEFPFHYYFPFPHQVKRSSSRSRSSRSSSSWLKRIENWERMRENIERWKKPLEIIESSPFLEFLFNCTHIATTTWWPWREKDERRRRWAKELISFLKLHREKGERDFTLEASEENSRRRMS